MELLEEVAELYDSGNRHRVVHRDADTRVRGVTSNVDDLQLFCLGDELLFESTVTLDAEVYVDAAAVGLLGPVDVIVA